MGGRKMVDAPINNSDHGNALDENHPLGSLGKNWGWLLALGIAFVILGIIGLGMSVGLTLASVLFFGVMILLGGIFQLIDTFKCTGWKGIVWHVLIGLLYVAAGIALISDPIVGSMIITILLGGVLLAVGLMRIIMGFQLKGHGGAWGWVLLSGVITLLLGFMILSRWPASGLFVIGLFIAIEMIMNGWTYIMMALAAKAVRDR